MSSEFVHLHVHSQYSLLDGAIKVKDLAERAKGNRMAALALTDHGNMFGAIQHYAACKERGIVPILGCEVSVVREGVRPPNRPNQNPELGEDLPVDHLVLLAGSETGYRNLIQLVSAGHLEPVSSRAPSITLDHVAKMSEGLIGLTGCMGGILAQRVLENGESAGRTYLERLSSVFEKGALYVELQDHGLPEQPIVNGIVSRAASDLGIPLVATNDVHFPSRAEGESQLVLSCIAQNRAFSAASASHHGSFEMYFKSQDEMTYLFRDQPEAIRSTLEIAERCGSWKLKLNEPMLPTFKVPDGFDTNSYFRHVAWEGLARRFSDAEKLGHGLDQERYRARLSEELDIICQMKFPGYFLIVWDFIRYARDSGIPVGPGRGSGAGSLVAYSLRITDLDPIPYNLLFERFLNPERVSMPDFDIDFCMDRRDAVIRYVGEKYGRRSVGQIATFHELKSRSVIKDVARTMGIAPNEAQKIASMVPQKGPGQMYTIPEALTVEPRLKALVETDRTVAELIKQAMQLEGLTRHAGMHAAGVVISEGDLDTHVPCFKNGEMIVTQYHKDDVEKAGLVKFDFLGLKTLTVIDIAEKLVNARPDQALKGEPFQVNTVPLTDESTYALLQSGDTTGVFQLESSGMQQLFKDLKPDAFEDIVAAVALYRPGPLGTGMVKDFVDCKHGRKPIQKMHDLVDELLAPTYGVIVYQEQVMQIAQKLAGYTLGGADLLRRAMGKKKPEEMAKQKSTFLSGASRLGVTQDDAERIFALLEYFAGYGFNKSHSAAYALLTYQTAYLKAHYPVEFLCALMTSDRDKIEKVVRVIAEGRAWGVETLPPEINESKVDFSVVYDVATADSDRGRAGKRLQDPLSPKIRFGLGAIRGIGESALDAVLEARKVGGPFLDLFDFASRVDARRVNRGVLEALIASGAFDGTMTAKDMHRARLFASIDRVLERGRTASKDRERGQASLFGLLAGSQGDTEEYPIADPWDSTLTLAKEKEALGFYVSGHPLDRYGIDLARFEVTLSSGIGTLENWSRVKVCGIVEGYRCRVFKGGGGKVAFFTLEDTVGRVEVKVREKQIDLFEGLLQNGEPVFLSAKVTYPMTEEGEEDSTPKEPTLVLDEAFSFAEIVRLQTRAMNIKLHESRHAELPFEGLARILREHPGSTAVSLHIDTASGEAILSTHLKVDLEADLFAKLERMVGTKALELR